MFIARRACACLLALSLVTPGVVLSAPKQAPAWPEVQRQIKVTEEVLEATLRDSLGKDLKVSSVRGTYLPNQGVLFNTKLSVPWVSVNTDDDGTGVHIKADLNLEEIPRMVHDILAELQIAVEPYAAEELSALKDLREEQRDLRKDERDIRSKLRKLRREQVREKDRDDREEIGEEIADLELELEATETAAESLKADIERQYERIKSNPEQERRQNVDAIDTSMAVTEAICQASSSLKSIDNEHYVTVALDQRGSMTFITYQMEDVKDCQRRDIDTSKLLDSAWIYEDS